MARPAKPEGEKNVQVSATISPAAHAALQDIRWEQRIEKLTDVVALAIAEFVAKHGKVNGEAPDTK